MASPAVNLSHTGNTATATFSSGIDAAVARLISIDGYEETLPAINDSDLATATYEEYIPGDLIDTGEVVLNVAFDSEIFDDMVFGTTATLTIVLPLRTGEATGATLAGTGFCVAKSMGEVANNQRVEGTITWKFDGQTDPTWTDGSAA